jgi:signal transduction histidine kinase
LQRTLSADIQAELVRHLRLATEQSATQRRSWAFVAQITISHLGVGLLMPLLKSARVSAAFGDLTPQAACFAAVPGLAMLWLNFILYRIRIRIRIQLHRNLAIPSWFASLAAGLETAALHGFLLGYWYASHRSLEWTWPLLIGTLAFWGYAQPLHLTRHLVAIAVTHGALGVAFVARADRVNAAWALGIGLVGMATCVKAAQVRVRRLRLEAKRVVLSARVEKLTLERERQRILLSLNSSIGAQLAAILADLDPVSRERAAQAMQGLEDIAAGASDGQSTSAELAVRIEGKCRPLCEHFYLVPLDSTTRDLRLSNPVASAIVHIAQELVRNAMTHGHATKVRIALTLRTGALCLEVEDDGKGLSPSMLARATGGLHNAQQWLSAHASALELVSPSEGFSTNVRAHLPTD